MTRTFFWNPEILPHVVEKARHVRDILRSNETELHQMPADRIDVGPLPNKRIASSCARKCAVAQNSILTRRGGSLPK